MIVDFHTHIFPDKIAKQTISLLESHTNGKAFTDGTETGLIKNMEKVGVDLSITLPVLTKPTQFDSVTKYAMGINQKYADSSRRIISFAGMHPECDDIAGKMKFLKDNGFLGVKIHPDYQNCYINHQGYITILNLARELDMIVVTHSGVDDGYAGLPIKCPPILCAEVIKKTKHKKFVLGHYGAHRQWQETLEILSDFDVYFDTALAYRSIDEKLFKDILKRHGEDKILFATDCPWGDIEKDLQVLYSYNLDKNVLDKILYKNALKLLNI